MKVAVTGANGHIGVAVCRHLLESGHRVRALVYRDDSAINGLDMERVSGSILDPSALDRLMEGAGAVQHLAGLISIRGDLGGRVPATNLAGTRHVLEACIRAGVRRMIHFSSIHAYTVPPFGQVMDENAALVRGSGFAYERSKSLAQQYVMDAAAAGVLETVCLNPTSVLGPWDFKPSLQGKMLVDLYRGRIPVLPPGGFDWVDNRDIARAACAAMQKGVPGEAYILSGRYAGVRDLVRLASEITGKPAPGVVLPFWALKMLAPVFELWGKAAGTPPVFTRESVAHLETGHPNISHAKAVRDLGYSARPLEETLRDSYAWLGQSGFLN